LRIFKNKFRVRRSIIGVYVSVNRWKWRWDTIDGDWPMLYLSSTGYPFSCVKKYRCRDGANVSRNVGRIYYNRNIY